MTDRYVLDENNATIPEPDLIKWAIWFEDSGRRRVARTTVEDHDVSTVFLGLDHSFGCGPPLLFETMIFGPGGERDVWRYSTWEQASAGHDRVVSELRDLVEKSPDNLLARFRVKPKRSQE